MGKFYIINAPWGFSTVWSLIKGWLDEATVAKIHILSSDYKTELQQQIPKESLPAFLGGSCFCGEGCQLSDAGPWKGKKGSSVRKLSLGREEGVAGVVAVENGGVEVPSTIVEGVEAGKEVVKT